MAYSTSTNYIMDQLASQRGASSGQSFHDWLSDFNYEVEIDTGLVTEAAQTILDHILDPFGTNRVILWGDFDCDGITSTAILYEALQYWGKLKPEHIIVHLPDRINHGHGINKHIVNRLIERHNLTDNKINTLLVVVDTGIEEKEGLKTFMTQLDNATFKSVFIDHHAAVDSKRVPLEWLSAYVFTHDLPKTHPCKLMCGAGLAGLVHMEINRLGVQDNPDKEPMPHPYDLMALGTIADMVPMKGLNRQVTRIGLKQMNTGIRYGLDSLISQTVHSNSRRKGLSTEDIAFNVAPKINAASRLSSHDEFKDGANIPFQLLTSNENTKDLVELLLKANIKRKELTETVWQEADQIYRNTPGWDQANCAIVYGPWPMGILGIVANKFIDKYQVPAFLLTDNKNAGLMYSPQHGDDYNNQMKGSARSPGNINLIKLLELSEDLFQDYGGHEGAGGFVVKQGKTIADMINSIAVNVPNAQRDKVEPVWNPDLIIPLAAVKYELILAQRELEPTGFDNKYPIFEIRNLFATDIMVIKGGHVRFSVQTENNPHKVNAIWFNPDQGYTLEGPFSALCEIKEDNYRKAGTVQLLIRKVKH